MAKNFEPESIPDKIGAGTVIKGDIKLNGDIRIEGTLIGTVNSKGRIVVGTTGSVEGEIVCQNAEFSGIIKAQITVTELLSLTATAKLSGDVITNKLAIEPGALFSGTCSMNNAPLKDTKLGEKIEPSKIKETAS